MHNEPGPPLTAGIQRGQGLGSLIPSLIHPRTPASIGVHHTPLSSQRDLRSRSCTMIRNPEKPYVPGGGVARARKSGPVRRGAGLGRCRLVVLLADSVAGRRAGDWGGLLVFEAGFFPGIGVRWKGWRRGPDLDGSRIVGSSSGA